MFVMGVTTVSPMNGSGRGQGAGIGRAGSDWRARRVGEREAEMQRAIEAEQCKIDAIDKRIDLVREELVRRSGRFDQMSAHDWQRAWDGYPGLQGMEASLLIRRADACDIRNNLIAKKALADACREARELRKSISKSSCPECGSPLLTERFIKSLVVPC